MCGIFGCLSDDASGKVLEGLRKLEYRGYDSAGIATILNGKIYIKPTRALEFIFIEFLITPTGASFEDI